MKLVVLTGAGISAESGIATFRDANGLWEGHDVMEVASPQGWEKNRELVLDFYNQRRQQAHLAKPNKGHLSLKKLEKDFEVSIVTQNVDNLHEQAGSKNVMHLHGELFKSQSTLDPSLIYDLKGSKLNVGDVCEKGSQLRPAIVWFGEAVPMMEVAIKETENADIFLIVGTSLQVYPAAGLLNYTPENCDVYIVDPHQPAIANNNNIHFIQENATTGVEKVAKLLKEKYC